jgi:class 3 adenylate cyclase
MARLQRKPLANPDEVRTFNNGHIQLYSLDDIDIGRSVFEPGWRWSNDVKPIAGTAFCMYHHVGIVLGGRLHVEMDDGLSLEIPADSAYEIPPGHDAWVVGDEPWVTLDFAGMRSYARTAVGSGDRALASILFTDIVDSTARAEQLGDSAWRELLRSHNERLQFELDRYTGRLIKATGDGILATFDSAERAVRCAAAACSSAASLGIGIRTAVHTGEVERVPGDIRGLAVHAAARIMSLAGPGEVLVSGTTRDLLTGSGLEFEDRGMVELKGLTGPRSIFALRFGSRADSTRIGASRSAVVARTNRRHRPGGGHRSRHDPQDSESVGA